MLSSTPHQTSKAPIYYTLIQTTTQQLVHENLVNLVDIFSHKKKIHLVFEYVERTLADDLEDHVNGIPEAEVRPIMWQVLKGIEFCHDRNVG